MNSAMAARTVCARADVGAAFAAQRHAPLSLERLGGVLGGLVDGGRHLVGLAVTAGDAAAAVADDHQGIEAEAAAALDHGGAAADLHHAFFEAVGPLLTIFRHRSVAPWGIGRRVAAASPPIRIRT